jgi:hypothetical protein
MPHCLVHVAVQVIGLVLTWQQVGQCHDLHMQWWWVGREAAVVGAKGAQRLLQFHALQQCL